MLCGDTGHKIILRGARQIHQPLVGSVRTDAAGVACHHVGVHIHRVDRVRDGDGVIVCKDIQYVAGITLCPVRYKDFIGFHFNTALFVGDFRNGFAQPCVPLFRPVSVERFALALVIHGFVHGINGGLGERLCHIANAAADDVGCFLRIGCGKCCYAAPDFREQVPALKFEKMLVYVGHDINVGLMMKKRIAVITKERRFLHGRQWLPAP